jgi:hypothetical protein
MATIRILAQAIIILNKSGAQRIEMDIPYQFKQIGVLLAQNGFIAVLKKVPATPVSFIIIPSVAG